MIVGIRSKLELKCIHCKYHILYSLIPNITSLDKILSNVIVAFRKNGFEFCLQSGYILGLMDKPIFITQILKKI